MSNGGAGKEPVVLGEHCKNLEFQRCAQVVDTGAEKESVRVWECKGEVEARKCQKWSRIMLGIG